MQNLSCRAPNIAKWSGVPSINFTGVSMQKFIISLICCLLPAFATASQPEVRDNAPDHHVVVKGDTLWDISEKFFKDPWKWPQIWGVNRETIKDPHWIYPGDVIVLDRTTGTLRIATKSDAAPTVTPGATGEAVKLSPRVHSQESTHNVIPSIPLGDIAPYLVQPVLLGKNGFENAPSIDATFERRVIIGNGDIAYVKGLTEGKGPEWQVYRPGKIFVDPDTEEVLGQEGIYLGSVAVEKLGDVSTVRVTKSVQEINVGDRLYQASDSTSGSYLPRAPEKKISARVISIYGGVSRGGKDSIIILNKGRRDGVESGHVLALYRKGEVLNKNLTLPDHRYGLLFVFRTFQKVAYALVVQASIPVELLDNAQTP